MTAILVSWPYLTKPMIDAVARGMADGSISGFLMDSGAFTAHQAGQTLSVSDYMGFIKGLGFSPTRYFQLDVIGDPQATMVNLEKMYEAGYEPIPIWQRGADPGVIPRMYELSPDLVALGGLVGNIPYARHVVANVWPQGRPYHLLGCTHLGMMARFRPPSVDSSTFLSIARFGKFQIYMGKGRFGSALTFGNRAPSPRERQFIRACGINPNELRRKAAWTRAESIAIRVGYAAWELYRRDLLKIGVKLYFALDTPRELGHVIDACRTADRIILNQEQRMI